MTPAAANRVAFDHIEGWVGERIYQVVEFIQQDHLAHDIRGDIAEIGVHHGKLFYILAAIARSDEALLAIDLFSRQELNIDQSGRGDRAVFEDHGARLFPHLLPQIQVLEGDSMTLRTSDYRAIMNHDGIRAFSVDGGHNPEHVVNDMSVAQELISTRGVVMLDDFFGYLWPSVTEGFFRYMATANRRLAPFLIFQNKLFLTTYSEHQSVLSSLRTYIEGSVGDEFHTRWRQGRLCGFNVLAYAR